MYVCLYLYCEYICIDVDDTKLYTTHDGAILEQPHSHGTAHLYYFVNLNSVKWRKAVWPTD